MKYIFTVILCNLCLLVAGQTHSSLRMSVTDSSNSPIEYANVALYLSVDTSLVCGGITNAEGEILLQNMEQGKYLLIASYIGYEKSMTEVTLSSGENKLGSVTLKESGVALNEVTVVGHKPIISMEEGILTTNIANSLLSTIGTAEDLLKYIPGLVVKRDEYIVLGKGTPTIYINNRKMRDNTELRGLSSEDIQKIELIMNPDVKYDAEIRCVLKIITKKKKNGFSMSLYGNTSQSKEFSNRENISLNYNYEGLNLFASYGYDNSKWQDLYELEYNIKGDTLWRQDNANVFKKDSRMHTVTTGLQYNINKKHSLGAEYRYATNKFDGEILSGDYDLYANEVLQEMAVSGGFNKMDMQQHMLNAFYQGQLSDKIKVELDADYVKRNNTILSAVSEIPSVTNIETISTTNNDNEFKVYAGKGSLSHQLNKKTSLQYGTEYSMVTGKGMFLSNAVSDNDFENRESKIAFFISSKFSIHKFGVGLGVRYEHVNSSAEEYGEKVVDRNYSDFFPSLHFSLPVKNVNMSLDFSNRVSRPSFSILNNNVQYINRFHQEKGNPFLQPEKIYDIDYSIGYRFLQFHLNYQYKKNYIDLYTEPSDVSQAVTLTTFKNFPKYQEIGAMIMAEYKIGCWTPSVEIGVYKQFFSTDYAGYRFDYNKPNMDVTFNNYVSLPLGIILNINMAYNTGGNMGTKIYEDYGNLDIGLRKSFFKESMVLSLWGYDIFDWKQYDTKEYMGKLFTRRHTHQDNRSVSFSISWKFNNYKSKYNGGSASGKEINRL